MSTRTLIRNFRIVLAPTTFLATRTFVASTQQYKTVTESVKDAAKTVDKTISKAAIKGLEGVEKVNEVARDTAEKVGIHAEKNFDELEVKAKTAAKAQVRGEQAKRDTKEGIRDAAGNVKDATR
jgi:fructose-1,6-bisphosphatase